MSCFYVLQCHKSICNVQVGGREDSNVYIRMKLKTAEEIGITASCMKLARSTTQLELLTKIRELNENPDVHGIIVQMPLDTTEDVDSHLITDAVAPNKVSIADIKTTPHGTPVQDVDGLCTVNEGRVATGDLKSGFLPCTPNGCMKMIEKSGVKVGGNKGNPAVDNILMHTDSRCQCCCSR